jgi:hypothetical protein
MINSIRRLFGNKDAEYKSQYKEQKKLAEHWEFRFNKLQRQLEELVSENGRK